MFDEGVVVSQKAADAVDEQEKFKMYYDYREPVQVRSRRTACWPSAAEKRESVLYFIIELDPAAPARRWCSSRFFAQPGDWTPHLSLAIDDCLEALAGFLDHNRDPPGTQETRRRRGHPGVSARTCRTCCWRPRRANSPVLGLDPGIRTGCKIAVVDETGKFLENGVIYPHPAQKRCRRRGAQLKTLIAKHKVSRHRHRQWHGVAGDRRPRPRLPPRRRRSTQVFCVTVNESGASIYSASDVAPRGIPRPRPHRARSHLHRPPPAGPSGRAGQARPEVHRRGPVSARRRPAPASAVARSRD